jgi:uncharacterized OB-fold protein
VFPFVQNAMYEIEKRTPKEKIVKINDEGECIGYECPSCFEEVAYYDKFCSNCGQELF